jgi:integrase/recombinase XerD
MSNLPVTQSVSPLRRRMLEDMAMRGLREDTQRDYIRFVKTFVMGTGRSTMMKDNGLRTLRAPSL